MKKLLLLAVFTGSFSLFGQGYHKLLNESFYWDVPFAAQAYICGGFADFGPWRYKISGDTVINDLTYSKIYYSDFSPVYPAPPNCPPFVVDTVFSHYPDAYLREDTVAKKVWRYDPSGGGSEVLLYDFTLQKGDTLEIRHWEWDWVIDTVMTITTFDGIERKKFVFYGDDGSIFPHIEGWYIEGIGGMAGLFEGPFPYFEVGTWLMCVKDENDNVIWNNSGDCYDFITGIDEVSNDKAIHVSPNPFTDQLTIETATGNLDVKIYNLFGAQLIQEEVDGSRIFDLSSFSPGIYLLKIRNDKDEVVMRKVVKASWL
jgi:hypothetical protein